MTGRRLGAAWLPFGATVLAVHSRKVAHWEEHVAGRVNQLPDALHGPLWVVMQSGALAAPPVAAAVALATGRRQAAGRLAVSGLSAYYVAKAVKRWIGRGRPVDFLPATIVRGQPATGNGFVSGHAAVSTALALEAWRTLDGPARAVPLTVAPVVGLARIYVGAHLPLDVLGGAALGWALHRTLDSLVQARSRRSAPATPGEDPASDIGSRRESGGTRRHDAAAAGLAAARSDVVARPDGRSRSARWRR
jgi:undecaprenyl-diphosphatase